MGLFDWFTRKGKKYPNRNYTLPETRPRPLRPPHQAETIRPSDVEIETIDEVDVPSQSTSHETPVTHHAPSHSTSIPLEPTYSPTPTHTPDTSTHHVDTTSHTSHVDTSSSFSSFDGGGHHH
jgi:hypothetical protein